MIDSVHHGRSDQGERLVRLRRLLAVLTAGSAAGTAAELLLIGHTHGTVQRLALWACAVLATAACTAATSDDGRVLRWCRWAATGASLVGAVGAARHLMGNASFARELHPERAPAATLWVAARGKLPVLAPLTLVLLAALVWSIAACAPASRTR